MYKKTILALLLAVCGMAAFGQTKPRLGILPFAGGSGGDGESIARLFSSQRDITNAFVVVNRNSAVNALVAEQQFQMSGYTDSDTIARLGRMLNADFVVSGFIRRLGGRNLIITTIINVETFEQLAGDYREYHTIEDVPALLPNISRVVIDASKRDTSQLPKLAILPFSIANTTGVNVQDAEVLAQILSIEVGNTGKYMILPRTSEIQAAMKELEYQMSGATAEEEVKALGRAINAEYVLSANVQRLGRLNQFWAAILNVEDGSQKISNYKDYSILADGITLMPELAKLLVSDMGGPSPRPPRPPRPPRKPSDPARYNSLGVSVGTTFSSPLVTGTIHGTISPWKHTFFELGMDAGMLTAAEDAEYFSLYPYARFALFVPFGKSGVAASNGWFAGAGGGMMMATYTFPGIGEVKGNIFALDVSTGFIFRGGFTVSYSLRTDFATVNNKLAVGWSYRFK